MDTLEVESSPVLGHQAARVVTPFQLPVKGRALFVTPASVKTLDRWAMAFVAVIVASWGLAMACSAPWTLSRESSS